MINFLALNGVAGDFRGGGGGDVSWSTTTFPLDERERSIYSQQITMS